MTAPNFGDKHPREELYWNGFEWVSFAAFEKCRDEEIARAEADAQTQSELAKSPLHFTDGKGNPLPDQAAALEEFKRRSAVTPKFIQVNFPAGPIDFPDTYDAEELLLVVHDALQERSRQVAKRGTEEDRRWNALDWKEMIDDYSAMARRSLCLGRDAEARKRFLQVIALGIAAVEALDANVSAARQAEARDIDPGSNRSFIGQGVQS